MNYTSFDLMKIFNIKRGSWYYLSKKLKLDNYCTFYNSSNNFVKKVYNEDAFNILQEYFKTESLKESIKYTSDDKNYLVILQQNAILSKNYEDLKAVSSKFQELYLSEKQKTETNILAINNLQNLNNDLQIENTNLKNQNSDLEIENQKLQLELENIKKRGFFKRLLNLF